MAVLKGWRRWRDALGLLPRPAGICLVTGCPRSGTSAVVEWLGHQEGVATFFESRVLIAAHRFLTEVHRFSDLHKRREELTAAARRLVIGYYAAHARIWGRLIVDKEPLEPIAFPAEDYGEFLDSLWALLPAVRVVCMMRHPVNVIWSLTQRQWGYSLTEPRLRDFTVDEGIALWKKNVVVADAVRSREGTVVLRLEDLVEHPDRVSGELRAFLGIKRLSTFEPQPRAQPGFGVAEIQRIIAATERERAAWGYGPEPST